LFPSREIKGEGAIVSTVDDMLRWAAHLTRQDRFGSPSTWAQLLVPHPGANPELGAYALGIRLSHHRGLRTIGHTGGVVGGSCDMLCLPDEDLQIVLLVNGAPGVTAQLSRKIVDIVLADRVGPADPIPAASDYEAWLGNWWSPETAMVYGLVDDEGVLKLQICAQPYEMDLKLTRDRKVILPEAYLGEVAFEFQADSLEIRFAGETHVYTRLQPEKVDTEQFAREIVGEFFSKDANAKASIVRTDMGLQMTLGDGFGESVGPVDPLGQEVAELGRASEAYGCVIQLIRESGTVRGFELNSGRTRHLEFRRV
jgi:hypothetical protein